MNRTHKFALLTCLYVAQGLPYGFFTQSLPALLRQEGMTLEKIGFSALLILPWAFKFLWAPILDRWGQRRTWIITMNLLAVGTLFIISFFSLDKLVTQGVMILFASFFILNLFSATQDIATDGLAVNQLSEEERGIGNGIQVAGYRIGMILGGGLLLAWFSQLGWQYSLWILAAILLLATLPVALFTEPPHKEEQEHLRLKDFIAFFKLPHMGLWLLVVLSFKFGDSFAGTMVRPLLIDEGLKVEDIALLLGTVGFTTGLLGALVGGWMVTLLGRFQALMLFGLLQVFALASWALLPMNIVEAASSTYTFLVYGISAVEHFTGGLATVALFTAMMDHCRNECAGSDYTIQACIVVFMTMIAAACSGVSAANLGYEQHFLLSGTLALLAIPLVWAYRTHFIHTQKI